MPLFLAACDFKDARHPIVSFVTGKLKHRSVGLRHRGPGLRPQGRVLERDRVASVSVLSRKKRSTRRVAPNEKPLKS